MGLFRPKAAVGLLKVIYLVVFGVALVPTNCIYTHAFAGPFSSQTKAPSRQPTQFMFDHVRTKRHFKFEPHPSFIRQQFPGLSEKSKRKSLLPSSSSTRLFSHHHEVIINGPFDLLLSKPEFWSAFIMLTIVGLLLAWEESVETLREKLPKALMPVVDSMLAEVGGLGFIGLFLGVVVTGGPLGEVIGELSEHFLGEEEILLETFEFLHEAFFEVGIGFFVVAGITVGAVLKEIQKISEVSELALDTDGDGEVSLEELADALDVQSLVVDADGDGEITEDEITDALRRSQKGGIIDEINLTPEELCSEALVIRERFILERKLPDSFLIEKYFEQIFAHNLEEIVELSPVTWLPLIPFLALDTSVDFEHDVISAASANAFETCGDFISTPAVFYPTVALQVLGLTWGLYNFWKMASIKGMLMPTLVRDGSDDGPAVLLPPRVEDEEIRRDFQSTPNFVAGIEEALGKPGTNRHERLFGAAGSNGPQLFLKSIKFHIWLCVTQIVFYGSQIVFRDIAALIAISGNSAIEVGNRDALLPETLVFGLFVLLSVGQLSLAPRTFLNYCFATSIEGMTKNWAVKIAMKESERVLEEEQEAAESDEVTSTATVSSNGEVLAKSPSSSLPSSSDSLDGPDQIVKELEQPSDATETLTNDSSVLSTADENINLKSEGRIVNEDDFDQSAETGPTLGSMEETLSVITATSTNELPKDDVALLSEETHDAPPTEILDGSTGERNASTVSAETDDSNSSNGVELEEVAENTNTVSLETGPQEDPEETHDESPLKILDEDTGDRNVSTVSAETDDSSSSNRVGLEEVPTKASPASLETEPREDPAQPVSTLDKSAQEYFRRTSGFM